MTFKWLNPDFCSQKSLHFSQGIVNNFYMTFGGLFLDFFFTENDPCIVVIKHGYTSNLTVRHLNIIHSFTRVYFKGMPGQVSKEVTMLPTNQVCSPSLVILAWLLLMSRAGFQACWQTVLESLKCPTAPMLSPSI